MEYQKTYIALKGTITVEVANDTDKQNRSLLLENNAPFISCVSNINGILIDNAKNLDVAMLVYN